MNVTNILNARPRLSPHPGSPEQPSLRELIEQHHVRVHGETAGAAMAAAHVEALERDLENREERTSEDRERKRSERTEEPIDQRILREIRTAVPIATGVMAIISEAVKEARTGKE